MKLIKYFKELLEVLKEIRNHLEKISGCVTNNRNGKHLKTGHWNN